MPASKAFRALSVHIIGFCLLLPGRIGYNGLLPDKFVQFLWWLRFHSELLEGPALCTWWLSVHVCQSLASVLNSHLAMWELQEQERASHPWWCAAGPVPPAQEFLLLSLLLLKLLLLPRFSSVDSGLVKGGTRVACLVFGILGTS